MSDNKHIIAIGSDVRTESLLRFIDLLPRLLVKVGRLYIPEPREQLEWPRVGKEIAKSVVNNEARFGMVFCDSGTGVCIAASRVPKARAVYCPDKQTAMLARYWNDANIIAMSHKWPPDKLLEIAAIFFNTEVSKQSLYTIDLLENDPLETGGSDANFST